ncbi:Centromere/kinetochore protein zw10-like protein [Colletotrichum trifolii]|uniref:Centromere/kinetochore protein zw10-like protein n=1 Tax=Colletotrichum trifolii TaxID=5466 RepID=A0A4R8RML0_COLTR|nr:Centromere/kinetochore protein zw10-like protein [Colletotrichum trifolii]
MAAVDTRTPLRLGEAIVGFALEGSFPDEQASSLSLSSTDLSPAIEALEQAKGDLESEIHTINEETKGDVSSWVNNAKTLQEDILRSKRLADDIVRQSEAPQVSGKAIQDVEDHVRFLEREVLYTQQLHEALRGVQHVNELLGEVEQAMNERRIIDSLRWLEKSWAELDAVPMNKKTCRVMRLLDLRAFELKSSVHDVFDHVWASLVHTDTQAGSLTIHEKLDGTCEQINLSEAIIGLQAYKEVEERMSQLWQDVDQAIVFPRMNSESTSLPSIRASDNTVELHGEAGRSIDELFADLRQLVEFVAQRLTPDLVMFFSPIMMNDLVPRLIRVWLDGAVPSTLKGIVGFQAVIQSARAFCEVLEENNFTGFTELKEWVGSAPSIWLAKCRETALDSVRKRLSNGIGESREVEKVEKQMVSRSEGNQLTANGVAAGTATDDDWGAAWGIDNDEPADANAAAQEGQEEDDGADAWGWDDEEQTDGKDAKPQATGPPAADEDDAADAWGWGGDDDYAEQAQPELQPQVPKLKKKAAVTGEDESREMVLRETYYISSMPEPVLELVLSILEDGAALTQPEYESSPVAAAAPGLFSLPTFALAMFRAVSPHYYALDIGGNMFLYNDAMYLSERLADLASAWKSRADLTPRAQSMLRIDNDIKSLQNFATRAYTNELGVQKTILRDLLGGDQSLMQQDELASCVDSAVARVRSMAVTWESILARSVWYQAMGSLVDAISAKIIGDVMDSSSIGQDDAYGIAQLIAKITELDDLFLPSRTAGHVSGTGSKDEIPTTAQYAATWLRLKYLSEVLQSNLNEVKYLWCDSELSLYFSADEVVDLIEASFDANPRMRETIRAIRENPSPVLA